MDTSLLDRLVALLHASGLQEIEFADGDVQIRLVKHRDGAAAVVGPAPSVPAPSVPAAPGAHAVVAGLTGTFYRAPSPAAPPYVEVGDDVVEGQTLGLLEAMKMLNPIEAVSAGRVAAIEAADGALVQRGAVLIRIAAPDAGT